MDAPTQTVEYQQLLLAVSDTQAVNFGAVAALTWLVYDTVLTFSEEKKKIWSGNWSLVKSLYTFLRYHTIIWFIICLSVSTNTGHLSLQLKNSQVVSKSFLRNIDMCDSLLAVAKDISGTTACPCGPLLSGAIGDALFLMRLNALYGNRRSVKVFMWSLYTVQFLSGGAIDAFLVATTTVIERQPHLPIPGCLAVVQSPLKRIKLSLCTWIIHLVLVSLFSSMSLFKFFGMISDLNHNQNRSMSTSVFEARKSMPIFFLFIRDNVFYCLVIFSKFTPAYSDLDAADQCDPPAALLINLVFVVHLITRVIGQVGTAWFISTYAVVSSRLVLNLGVTTTGVTTTQEFELSRFSDTGAMEFRSPAATSTAGLQTVESNSV
ncbi:hypothetical protein BDZ89DRAFT_1165412 [Hymenopellis radicata]|nr:hypothetical protein BDZ89DRAFT_1165412 [Hymenopellis radicata]